MKDLETENYILKEIEDGRVQVFYRDTEVSKIATAKEMFEELGYEYSNNGTQICYFNNIQEEYIWFYLETETIEIQFDITIPLLKAINKQVEELRWLDG